MSINTRTGRPDVALRESLAATLADLPNVHLLISAVTDVLTYTNECEAIGVSMHPADVRSLVAAALGPAAEIAAAETAAAEIEFAPEAVAVKDGHATVTSRFDGSWRADCARCGGAVAAAGTPAIDDDLDVEDERLERFLAEHRDCGAAPEGSEAGED